MALAVLTGLVLIARPANEGSVPLEVADLLPRAVTAAQTIPASAGPPPPARARRPQAAPATTTPLSRTRAADRLQSP